jgi:hypothetical protein
MQEPEMTNIFRKLNYKGQKEICIVDAPAEFANEVEAMKHMATVKTDIKGCKDIEFILTFVTTKKEIDKMAPFIDEKLKGDGIVWFAYPKGTSKKYKVEINRDNGWDSVRKIGLESVRAVAIDNDWSALRYRRLAFVKSKK